MHPTRPETEAFGKYLAEVGEALDRFVEFEHPDPGRSAPSWEAQLVGPVPRTGVGAAQTAHELRELLIPNGSRISDPRFWGFVTTGPTTMPVVAQTAAAIAGPQRYTINAFNLVEELTLDWLAEMFELPAAMKGVYVSGGSVANLVALGAARQVAFEAAGLDPAASGLDGRPAAVYTSTEAHHTIQRAAGVLGLGRSRVRLIAVDDHQRMVPGELARTLAEDKQRGVLPVAVVAAAGTTNTGAIDPLRAVGEIARSHGAWFHIDGAYGLPGILDDRIRDRYDGLELADSVIVDPHKWLCAPVGVAAAFVRDRSILHRAFTQEPADYLEGSFAKDEGIVSSIDSMGIPYGDLAVELSAPARGVQVWSIIRELGVDGIAGRVAADNDLAARVASAAAEHARLESLTEPQLSVACIRYVAATGDLDELNEVLLRRLVRETSFAPSATMVDGRFAIRPCFINARTTTEQVDAFVAALVALGDDETGLTASAVGGSDP